MQVPLEVLHLATREGSQQDLMQVPHIHRLRLRIPRHHTHGRRMNYLLHQYRITPSDWLKMTPNQDICRDEQQIDISFQLLCFGLLDASNFDGPLLRRDIPDGK